MTELGRKQAEAVGRRVEGFLRESEAVLYSSDMTRARETAEIVGFVLGRKPAFHAGLREWSDALALERKMRPVKRDPQPGESFLDWRPCPEHETWREFLARVSAFMEQLSSADLNGATPVLVLHGGSLSNVVIWWLGIPLDVLPETTCFSATPGSMSVLKKNRYGNPVVERLNDTSHLAACGG